jgi:hypothetical protein
MTIGELPNQFPNRDPTSANNIFREIIKSSETGFLTMQRMTFFRAIHNFRAFRDSKELTP